MTNLAINLRVLGEYEQARQLDEDALDRSRRILGENHPETLRVANNLAVDLQALRQTDAARLLNEDTLARRLRVLGEDHPDTLTSAYNLAADLRALGEYEAARQLDEDGRRRASHPPVETRRESEVPLTVKSTKLEVEPGMVIRAFAMAGYRLEPSDRPGILTAAEDDVVVTTDEEGNLDSIARYLRPRGIVYVTYSGRLRKVSEQRIDRLRVGGKLVVPLSLRALDAALSDGNVSTLLADMRNYGARDNLFDTKNALMDERHFFGRDAILTRMGTLVRRNEHILLTGLRKVGKTSLLNIFRQHLLQYPVCKVDLQAYDRGEDWHSSVFREALAAFDKWARQRMISWDFRPEAPTDATAFQHAVDCRLEELGDGAETVRLVLLLDEVERVFPLHGEKDETRRWLRAAQSLRSVAQAASRRLVIVAADLRPTANRINLLDTGETNPFYDFFHEIAVPLFDWNATKEMTKTIGAAMDIEVDDKFVEELHRLSGGHPSFSRSVAAEASRRRSARRRLTVKDLSVAVQVMLENGKVDAFLKSNIWDPLTPAEKQVVIAMVHGGVRGRRNIDIDFQLRQAEQNLREQGLIDDGRLTLGALANWIRDREVGASP